MGFVTTIILCALLMVLGLVQIIFVVLNSKAKNDLKNHTALGVLQIIFASVPAGILILIKNKTCRKVAFALSIVACVGMFLCGLIFLITGTAITHSM
jgi:hypothetical protein